MNTDNLGFKSVAKNAIVDTIDRFVHPRYKRG